MGGLVSGCGLLDPPPGYRATIDDEIDNLKSKINDLAVQRAYWVILKSNPDLAIKARERIEAIDRRLEELHVELAKLEAEREARKRKAERAQSLSPGPTPDATGGCFTPDTRILLPDGVKNIAAMNVGDELVAYYEATGEMTPRPVVQTYRFPANHYFVINGEIRVTATHRFLTNRGWVRIKDLEIGDLLRTSEGWVPLESKEFVEANLEVFNLEVATNHHFFVVGEKHSYLVHNCGGGGK
jgi:hypothetical protein